MSDVVDAGGSARVPVLVGGRVGVVGEPLAQRDLETAPAFEAAIANNVQALSHAQMLARD
jgi:hypothetical protein